MAFCPIYRIFSVVLLIALLTWRPGLAVDALKGEPPSGAAVEDSEKDTAPGVTDSGRNSEEKQSIIPEPAKPEMPAIEKTKKDEQKNQDEKTKTEESPSPEIEPECIHNLMSFESGHNDSNPVWSPAGEFIAFERNTEDKKEILITRCDGTIVRKIYYRLSDKDNNLGFFLPGIIEDVSYNSGLSWSPKGDRFVFMSNGGSGNYDIYLYELASDTTTRLTTHKEKDGQAHWSPLADLIVFVSGRTGKADIFLMDLATREVKQLTRGKKSYLYPQWSPDGRRIVVTYGSNENHDVYLIDDITKPFESMKALTTWAHDDLRPAWSPDGKKIAFYSNYNQENDPKVWSLIVISSDGSDPAKGDGLAAKVAAYDVVPDIEHGPSWLQDSNRIVYVKNDKLAYNPIFIADITEKSNLPIKTGTKMNHDVSCSADGHIAFRAQIEQWDQIYVTKLKK